MPTYIYIIDKHYNLLTELGILNMRDIIELKYYLRFSGE